MSTTEYAARAQDATLANRYGVNHRARNRRPLWIALGAVALLASVALAVVIGVTTSQGRIDHTDVGYEIRDDAHASVTFQATVPPGVSAECDLVVLDAQAGPVGFRTVRLESLPEHQRERPSDDTWHYTVDVRTVGRGVSGTVDTCRPV